GAVARACAGGWRARHLDPAPTRYPWDHGASRFRHALSGHQGTGAMSTTDSALDIAAEPTPIRWRPYVVTAGRIVLALLLLWVWRLGADLKGPLFVADPVPVAQRIVEDTMSGALLRHIYVTLRLAAIGFVIGCVFGVAAPFALRRLPRLTNAIEP